jgi:hypothetical protein
MKSRTMLLTAARVLVTLLAIAAQPSAWGQTFTTFDPPGSQGTSPASINPAGQIVGTYFDSNFATHGFVRATDGTITSFDAPGMINGSAPPLITPQGLIVGTYFDANFATHIFLRAKDGTITTLDIPSPGAFIYAVVANSAGAIAGASIDSNGTPQLFLRAASGTFTLVEFPPAFLTSFFVPSIVGITPGGTIMGSYFDSNFVIHGFLRTIDGNFTTFDAPNAAAFFFEGTTPTSINDSGIVTGFYFDTTQNSELRVFLRASDGTFSSFATPQLGTFGGVASINSSGAVAGNVQNTVCSDGSCTNVPISFLRAANGTVSSVNDPQAVQGTQVIGINPAGEIIGVYSDVNNVQHGFLKTP